MQIDKHTPVPIYYQLATEMRRRIEAGEWRPGDQLPSERELSRSFSISHMTARQALTALVDEGLVRRERGRGTFVSDPKIHKPLSSLTSFTEFMRSSGKRPGARILRLEQEPAPPNVCEALNLAPGQLVVIVERLRTADDEDLGIERAHLHFPGCERLLNEDLTGSLYQMLKTRHGIIPARAEESIEAVPCPPREAKLLGVKPGSPALHIVRCTFSQDEKAIEVVESIYRGDKYIIHARLTTGMPV